MHTKCWIPLIAGTKQIAMNATEYDRAAYQEQNQQQIHKCGLSARHNAARGGEHQSF